MPTPQSERGAREDWSTEVSPGGFSPAAPPPPPRPAQVRFPAQATGTATLREVEADSAARGREKDPGDAPSLAQIHPRASLGARARGLRALQLRKPGEADRSALAANSSAVRPPSWACSVRPPSANSEARAPRPWGRERRRRRAGVARRPQTVANFAASPELARPRLIPYKSDQIQLPPPAPSQPESWRLRPPKCRRGWRPLTTSRGPTGKLLGAGGGGRRAAGGGRGVGGARDARGLATPVGTRCQPSSPPPLPQPLEGQQRVKSAPSHREHGPLHPLRPLAARLGVCPEPPRGPEPRMRHRSPAGV